MSDVLRQSGRRTLALALWCGTLILAGFAWVLAPASVPRIEAPSLEIAGRGAEVINVPPLEEEAFRTPVWTMAAAAPASPAPAPPPPPPPPLKMQLIGILKEEQVYRAVLYDPDTNKLFVVATGGEALGHKIDRVAADAVTVRDGLLVRTLALKTSGAGGGNLGGGP